MLLSSRCLVFGLLIFLVINVSSAQDEQEELAIEEDVEVDTDDETESVVPSEVEDDSSSLEIERDTYLGPVVGLKFQSESGNTFYKFLGIPYAEPPVGKLRFKDPVPKKPWLLPRNATEYGAYCIQNAAGLELFEEGPVQVDEDCLTLNVFSPSVPKTSTFGFVKKSTLKPVMVWIHGGGLTSGAASQYDPEYLLDQDVVVVTINYRLGMFGFMSLENRLVSGNQGLKDQTEALRWVQKNIAYFGGDPSKVTIFGESAGGWSVNYQILSPSAKGLFHAGILQSGSLFRYFNNDRNRLSSIQLIEDANCTKSRIQDSIDCMQQIDGKELQEIFESTVGNQLSFATAVKNYVEGPIRGLWEPVVDTYADKPFLPLQPIKAIMDGKFNRVPIMIGITKDDGVLFPGILYSAGEENKFDYVNGVPIFSFGKLPDEITEEEKLNVNVSLQFYTGKQSNFTEDDLKGLTNLFTDSFFSVSAYYIAKQYSKHNIPAYVYELNEQLEEGFINFYYPNATENFVAHGDDIAFLFKDTVGIAGTKTESNKKTSELMLELWTNFSKYREPTPFENGNAPFWNIFDATNETYIELKSTPEIKHGFHPVRMQLWKTLFMENLIARVQQRENVQSVLEQFISNLPTEGIENKNFVPASRNKLFV